MNNNLFFFFTATQDQCMQVLLLRPAAYSAKNSSHSKATKINQEIGQVTVLISPVSFLVRMIQKSRAAQLYFTCTMWQQGNIATMALCSFTSVAQEMFGTAHARYNNYHCDTMGSSTVGRNNIIFSVTPVCLHATLCYAVLSVQPFSKL